MLGRIICLGLVEFPLEIGWAQQVRRFQESTIIVIGGHPHLLTQLIFGRAMELTATIILIDPTSQKERDIVFDV
jgi:hypothetical protein